MRNSLMILFGISMIAAFACGGSSKPEPTAASPTPVSDEAFKAAATTAANAIQITSADLPGWTGKPYVKSNTQFDLSPECATFNQETSPNAAVDTYSDDFTDAADRTVSSGVTIYRTAELASKDSADFTVLLGRCRGEVSGAAEASIVKEAPGATARVAFDAIAANELGGWTNGYKMSISATSADGARTSHSDVTVFWKLNGRIIVTFEFDGDKPIDASMRDDLKALLVKRMADAEPTLPR